MNGVRRYLAACLAAAVVLTWGQRASAQPTAAEVNEDLWYVLKLQDRQCGYMHTVTRLDGKEVRTQSFTSLKIARGQTKVKVTVEQEHAETVDGKPLRIMSRMGLGETPVTYRGTIEGDRIKLETEQYGSKKTATYPFDPEIKFVWGQELDQRQRGLRPGTEFSVKTYDPSLKPDGPVNLQVSVRGKEKVNVLGMPRELHRVTTVMEIPSADSAGGEEAGKGMTLETQSWVDDEARPVITTMEMGIAKVMMFQATKEEALREADPPELFLNTFVETSRTIGTEAKSVTYRLRVKDEAGGPSLQRWGMPDLPNTSMQKVKRIGRNELEMKVSRLNWEKICQVRASATDTEKLAEYLKASSMADINDKKIKRLARQAVKGGQTPAEKADALRKFVTKYIEHKGMDVGFATASEVARNRTGDCTEHGVLLVALARAAGLPARGVSGLVEVPGGYLGWPIASAVGEKPAGKSAFGYHMWAQVYIGGQWVDIDGAMRQTDCDPTHIALGVMSLNEGQGVIESFSALLPLLGRLEIEIVNVEE